MKTIIERIEVDLFNEISYLCVGYTNNDELVNEINKNYDLTLGKFVEENRLKLENGEINIYKFFENTSFVFEARQKTDSDLNELTEITNFNQL